MVASTGFRLPLANAADYTGKLFVFVQAQGGWDPTSFCDPKTNVSGELKINHWADSDEIREAGNIRYAPFGDNQTFFEKYYRRMLVINGVDAQTNSHTAGVVHNLERAHFGRLSDNHGTTGRAQWGGADDALPELWRFLEHDGHRCVHAAQYRAGAEYCKTLTYPIRVQMRGPMSPRWTWETLTTRRNARLARLAAAPNLMPRDARNRALYAFSCASRGYGGNCEHLPT